jgi:hypothetical protein
MATAVDMTDSITGMVIKPVEEYRHEQRRRERERRRDLSTQNNPYKPPETDNLNPRASPTPSQTSGVTTTSTASSSSPTKPKPTQRSLGSTAALASAKSISMLAPIAAKGMLVDIPLAITEGLRSLPTHLGTTKTHHHHQISPVTDAKSGAAAAGQTFAFGFIDGLSDFVMEPIRGARDGGGAVGAVKGMGKGAVSLVAKSGAGMFGLFAYPSQGIAKSVRRAVHIGTRKAVERAKHEEGRWLLGAGGGGLLEGVEGEGLVGRFGELANGSGR